MSGAEKLVEQIIKTLNENKAVDIVKIDLRRIENCFCSFFVICHGTSNTHVASLTDFVYDEVNEKLGEKPLHVEEMWLYIYFKKNNEIIINLKIFGLTRK